MNPVSDELEAWKCLHSRLAVLGFRPALKRPSRGRAHAWALRTEKTLHLLLLLRLLQCKLHTLVGSMHDEHLSWPALTETHMTPPDK